MPESHQSKPKKKITQGPGQLDAALSIVSPQGWIWLATIGAVILGILIWAFFGKVTFRATGIGIILKQDSVLYDINSTAEGIVTQIDVEIGQLVRPGDRLVNIRFPTRETEQLANERVVKELEQQVERQQEFMKSDLPRREKDLFKKVEAREKDEQSDQQLIEFLTSLQKTQIEELKQGYITRQQLESTLNQLHQSQSSLRTTQNDIRTLETNHEEYINQQITTLEQLRQQLTESRGKLAQLDVSLEEGAVITSPIFGTIVEVDVNPGERISAAKQLFVIEESGEGLQFLSYFDNKYGKKLRSGMKAHVSPRSIERDIYGTISAKVDKVSLLPVTREALERVLGDPGLVAQLINGGAPIQAHVTLETDKTTHTKLRWTSSSGPPHEVTSGTIAGIEVVVQELPPIDLLVPLYETWIKGNE
ncbi:MAG: NHLP bacteriocin system secretion protein [Myxococcota bacterium]|nr:NHLP bacteriocin system secretion protein [Spirochaeta sp.]RPG12612.1 MAG: NHLP bacteriocin system secretion protein [Proteobacteria bacterium TMED72]